MNDKLVIERNRKAEAIRSPLVMQHTHLHLTFARYSARIEGAAPCDFEVLHIRVLNYGGADCSEKSSSFSRIQAVSRCLNSRLWTVHTSCTIG